MRLLLDANAFVWWVTDSPGLTAKARATIADAANDVVVGIGALWELAIKRSLQKLHFPFDFETVLNDENFQVLAISFAHLRALDALPRHHNDPFDRLLIAQGLTEGIPIATGDRRFAAYGVQIVW
ncbi:MAG: type II toxin-antitoxin system VapC family toxin [Stellaceae bacterium]